MALGRARRTARRGRGGPPYAGAALPPPEALGPDEELVAGRRPVEEAFAARRPAIRLLVVPQRRAALEKLVLHATSLRIPIVEVEGGSLTALAGFDGHQGVALVVEPRRFATHRRRARAGRRAGRAAVRARPRLARGPPERRARCCEAPRPPASTACCSRPIARRRCAVGRQGFGGRRRAPAARARSTTSPGRSATSMRAAADRGRRRRCAADRAGRGPARAARDRGRQRGAGPRAGGPPTMRSLRAHPDAGRGRVAERGRRRLDPALRGGRPARPRSRPTSAPGEATPTARRVSPRRRAAAEPRAVDPGRPSRRRPPEPRDARAGRRSVAAEAARGPRPDRPRSRPTGDAPPSAEARQVAPVSRRRRHAARDPSTGSALPVPRRRISHQRFGPARRADVAQLVEQRFCKPHVPVRVPSSALVVRGAIRPRPRVLGSRARRRLDPHHPHAASTTAGWTSRSCAASPTSASSRTPRGASPRSSLAVIGYACTSGSFIKGLDGEPDQGHHARQRGAAAVTTE